MKKFGRIVLAGLAALAITPTAWAASAGSSASIYDITFEVASLDHSSAPWLTFGDPSVEATYVQVSASDSVGNTDTSFTSGSTLYASLYRTAGVSEGGGQSIATAASGSTWLSASGSTSISLGSYAAESGLNQEYQGTSTLGGWFTVSPMSQVTLSGFFNVQAWISGTPCGPTGVCSSSFAQARAGIADDIAAEWIEVTGDSGATSSQRTGSFSFVYRNLLDVAADVFFFTSATVWGTASDAIDGGTGEVPEPASWATLLIGLAALVGLQRRRSGAKLAQPARLAA